MSSHKRITKAYKTARRISFNDDSKFIVFSDCHRGDNSFADDFANNRNIYYHALSHYFKEDYTYCELGDGDELWENITFRSIFEAHQNVFELMRKFYEQNRLYRVLGNHDMVFQKEKYVEKYLFKHFDKITGKDKSLFPGIEFTEALVFEHEESKQELFMLHGHQADWMNYRGWKFNRFMVRAVWRPLQIFGISDPTSPAKNYRELIKVEKRFKQWITDNNRLITIIGHTHRPRFPEPHETPLFNDGSCVHPRSITGLEVEKGQISLIKWHIQTDESGALRVVRKLLEGPQMLAHY